MALPTISALNSVGGTVTLNTLATGRQNAVDSSATVLSNEDLAAINAITTKLTAGISATTATPSTDTIMQAAAIAVGNGTILPVTGYGTSLIQITGTFVGSIVFEGTEDGTNYFAVAATQMGVGIITSTATVPGLYRSVVAGLANIRARISVYTSGSISALGRTTNVPVTSKFIQLVAGAAVIGAVTGSGNFAVTVAALPLPTGAALDTSLATLHADLIASTPAGENHVGNVSTPAAVIVTQAPAVTVGAYATGNVVGGLLTFAGAARAAGLDGLVQQVVVFCKSAQTTAFDLIMFHTSPASSTFTDKTALVVNVVDFDKIIGVAHITDWTNLGGASVAQALNLAMPYKIAGGSTTAYGVLVARSAPTFASTSDIEVALKVLPN